MKIVLEGDVPSKKNSRVITMRGGRIRSFPSKRYKEWEEYVIPKLKEEKASFNGPVHIICKFWMGSNRKSDLDNRLASICDALKEAGVIEDDNWKVVGHIEGIAMGVEKNTPRVEIIIEEINEGVIANKNLLVAVLNYLNDELTRVMENITQEEYSSPFYNTGNKFEQLDEFKVRAYDWGWDFSDDDSPQPANFTWRDVEIRWYKYMGRGMEISREMSNDELSEMLDECLEAIWKYEQNIDKKDRA